jgi:hypothetical protein
MGNIRGTQKVGKWLRPLQRNLKSEELAKAKKLGRPLQRNLKSEELAKAKKLGKENAVLRLESGYVHSLPKL